MYQEQLVETGGGGAAQCVRRTSAGCADCRVSQTAICAELAVDTRDALAGSARHRRLRKGQTLFWEGDEVGFVGTVVSGMLTLSRNARDGGELILGMVGPGGVVGYPDRSAARANAVAVTETELCLFPIEAFNRFADTNPSLRARLIDQMFHELEHTRHWLFMLGRGSAAERIASMLLEFAGAGAPEGTHALPISRGRIAHVTGLAIETVSRQLSSLVRAGIIALPSRDRFVLRDRRALLSIAGLAPAHDTH